jgi:hypothetical protein
MKQEEKPREKCDLKKSPRVNVLLPITFCTFAMGVRFDSNVT